jgi:hypothetical protein
MANINLAETKSGHGPLRYCRCGGRPSRGPFLRSLSSSSRPILLLAATIAMAISLCACSSRTNIAAEKLKLRQATLPRHDPAARSSGAKSSVISAWKEAEMAIWRAKETGSVEDPTLPALLAPPMLRYLEEDVKDLDQDGLRLIGPISLGSPQVHLVSTHVAHLTSCVDDQEIYVSVSGAPVQSNMDSPGLLKVRATLVRSSLGWVLEAQISQRAEKCGSSSYARPVAVHGTSKTRGADTKAKEKAKTQDKKGSK